LQQGEKTVFPIAVEPIVRQDGNKKNDCELNAAKRLVPQIRQVMPTEKLLLTLDALYTNAPLVRLLMEHHISFLIGVKDGYVPMQVERLTTQGAMKEISWETKGRMCANQLANGLILNGQNQDLQVNYLEYMVEICNTKRALWEKVRQFFDLLPVLSMNAIYRFIALNRQANHPMLE